MRPLSIAPGERCPLVFVIDDHEDSRELMRQWFEMEGFEVAAFVDGCHAVEDVLRYKPDIIVMDGRLPGQDGWSVTRRVRSVSGLAANTPIVLVSAATDAASQAAAVNSGCDCYLTKPVDLYRLMDVVDGLLRSSRRDMAYHSLSAGLRHQGAQ